eukprot:2563599-Prymnesium_polylepis.1
MPPVVALVPKGQEVVQEDPELADFLQQVNQLQADMATMSGEDHIARLHRPGAKYFNMNPFEVLGLNHKVEVEQVKQAYRKLSVKVHPDKNQGNPLAAAAFEIIKAASERLDDEERRQFCVRICAAAEEAAEKKVKAAKKKLRKEGEDDSVPEDDPARMEMTVKVRAATQSFGRAHTSQSRSSGLAHTSQSRAVRFPAARCHAFCCSAPQVMISRMFAEFEQRKKQLEARDAQQKQKAKEEQARARTCERPEGIMPWRRRQRCFPTMPSWRMSRRAQHHPCTRCVCSQAEREFMDALKKREEKMWEKSRQKRVSGWRNW